jgi:hypothetical protein
MLEILHQGTSFIDSPCPFREHREMRILLQRCVWVSSLALSSCAVTASEGMLASITAPKTLDKPYLERQCDVEDAAACYFLRGKLPALPRVPILQGVAPGDRAVFVVQLGPLAEVRYFLRQKEDQSVRALPVAKTYTRESSAWRLERLELSKLDPAKSYELLLTDRTGQLVDVRSFKPMRDGAEGFRFAFFSGGADAGSGDDSVWRGLLDRQPRLVISLGNLVATHGPDPLDPLALWERYADARARTGFFRQASLVPMAASWAPADYGATEKNRGRANPNADAAREIQEAFFPAAGDGQAVNEGPGIAKAIQTGGHTFVLLDAQSFREGDAVPPVCRTHPSATCPPAVEAEPGSGSAHFGNLQESWARGVAEGAEGPVWFLSSDPWFGAAYPVASFEGSHAAAFQDFRSELSEALRKAKHHHPLLFGSANPLFSEARPLRPFLKSGYESMEFSAGPWSGLSAKVEGVPAAARRTYRSENGGYLFFTSWPKGNALTLSAEAVEPGNRAGFSLRFEGKPFAPSPDKTKSKAKARAKSSR